MSNLGPRLRYNASQPGFALILSAALLAFNDVLPVTQVVHIVLWVVAGVGFVAAGAYLFLPVRPAQQPPVARMDKDGNVDIYDPNTGASVMPLPGGGRALHVDYLRQPNAKPTSWSRLWRRGSPPHGHNSEQPPCD